MTPVTKKAKKYTVKVSQKAIDSTKATITVKKAKALKKKGVKKVKVIATMKNGSKVAIKKTKTYKIGKIIKQGKKVSFTFPEYGTYQVKVKFYGAKGKPKKLVKTVTVKNVGIAASEYNIAVLQATMPELIFALSVYDDSDIMTSDTTGKTISTYVVAKRPKSYDWDSMPAGMESVPFVESGTSGSFSSRYKAMKNYIESLYKANKNSKFNFFISDLTIKYVYDAMYANGIDDDHLKVYMLSDGSGSFTTFNEMYDVDDPWALNSSAVSELVRLQNKVVAGKSVDYTSLNYSVSSSADAELKHYTYAAVYSHDNYEWWITYSGGFSVSDSTFTSQAKKSLTTVSITDSLTQIEANGNTAAFKELFNMSDDLFAEAEKADKSPLVIMGARVYSETDFEPFAKFLMSYYGDDYLYYYKGHPGTPTSSYPEKAQQLERLGITDIDSSIPAELILFYYPDVYVAGLSNSTLNSSYQEGHTLAYLGTRLADKDSITGGDLFEMFFTKIDSTYEEAITSLVSGSDPNFEHSFLIELNDGSHDIIIYDEEAGTFTQYSLGDDRSYAVKS